MTNSDKRQIRIFDPKDLGTTLHEVSYDVIRTEDADLESRWFHSARDADFFLWRDDKKNIIKQQVTFFGQVVEWNALEGVRTGLLIDDDSNPRKGTPLVRFDSAPQPKAIEQGVEIIGHIPGLNRADKTSVIENFLRAPELVGVSVEEILKQMGLEHPPTPGGWLSRFIEALGFWKNKK